MAGHLGPFWSPTFGSHIYGPGSSGLYQRKLECDTIVIFIQRARHVSRNHAWYTRCHTNKTEIMYFFWLYFSSPQKGSYSCIWLWLLVVHITCFDCAMVRSQITVQPQEGHFTFGGAPYILIALHWMHKCCSQLRQNIHFYTNWQIYKLTPRPHEHRWFNVDPLCQI